MKTLLTDLFVAFVLVGSVSAVDFSTAEIAGKPLTVCRVNIRKERLQLFLRDDDGQPIKRFERLAGLLGARGQKLTFAMNAGMYHGDFSPVGLFISDGKQLSPLNTANAEGNFFLKPNGVFVITETGARVVETSEFPSIRERVILATQSGPMLVHRGKLHPAFNAKSESRLSRNGVCSPTPDVAVFVNSEAPVNLYEFATFFRDTLHCTEALFLDATINSLHSTELNRSDFRMDLGPIIGIAE
ncbi:MAG TPA: phosphodiester glycosidase family protein [Thermoanaerobaculia bacterium]|nr:phosphodiester glycosidase family protein [Thermoanaerobaculia bacterium]